jgi:hypothetical protein
VDVEHVGTEGNGADFGHTRGAVAAHQTEQGVDAPHPRPRQRAVEQRGGVAADDLAGGLGLAPQGVDIAHRVDTALGRIVTRIDRLAAWRLSWMRFD